MRDELLNESLFVDLDQARQLIGDWPADYNTARPHSSLGYKTPAAYAGTHCPSLIAMPGYFSDVLTEVYLLFNVLPRPLTAAMIAILNPPAMSAYSIAVAADWSDKNLKTSFFKTTSLWM